MTKTGYSISQVEMDEMFERMFSFVQTMATFDKNEIEELRLFCNPVRLKKNSLFLREGEKCQQIAYLDKGMVRFYHDRNDEEITSDFCFDDTFITGYFSLITGMPSDTSIQTLEDCTMLVIKRDKLFKLYDTNHRFERIGRIIAEQNFLIARKHLLSFLNESAETRYKNLIERAPHFVQRIPLLYIASYLGISPETLSRIRRKLSIS